MQRESLVVSFFVFLDTMRFSAYKSMLHRMQVLYMQKSVLVSVVQLWTISYAHMTGLHNARKTDSAQLSYPEARPTLWRCLEKEECTL